MPKWSRPPAQRCGRTPARRASSGVSTAACRVAMSSRSVVPSSSKPWTRPATPERMSACWRTAMLQPCSVVTHCSTPAPAIATTAAMRVCFTRPSSTSSPNYPTRPASIRAMNTWLAISPSPWIANPATRGHTCACRGARARALHRAGHDAGRREARQYVPAAFESGDHCATAREVSGHRRESRRAHRVHQVARVAQSLVGRRFRPARPRKIRPGPAGSAVPSCARPQS